MIPGWRRSLKTTLRNLKMTPLKMTLLEGPMKTLKVSATPLKVTMTV